MALHGNQDVLLKTPGRWLGGVSVSGLRGNFSRSGSNRAMFYQDSATSMALSAVPLGYSPPSSFIIAQIDGAITSNNDAAGSGTLAGSAAMGLPSSVTVYGTSTASATGQLVTSASATVSGSSTVSGNCKATLSASSTVLSSGSAEATISALAWASSNVSGSSTTGATIRATGAMSASVTPYSELSPQSLAAAVHDAQVEGDLSFKAATRILLSVLAGRSEVSGGSIIFKDTTGTVSRVLASVDASGNRTDVELNAND